VLTERSAQGASYRFGRAEAGNVYELELEARAKDGALPLAFGLNDTRRLEEGRVRTAVVDGDWSRHRLRWEPREDARTARLYVWHNGARGRFELRSIEVRERAPDGSVRTIDVPMRPERSVYAHYQRIRDDAQGRYVDSRLDAARGSLEAFAGSPVTGLGLDDFDDYAAENLEYGELATHNEVLRIAAELGLVGLILAGAMVLVLVAAYRAAPRGGAVLTAAAGTLVAGLAGNLFVNGITFEAGSVPLPFAMAVLAACSRD
jgi:hypothetical protein